MATWSTSFLILNVLLFLTSAIICFVTWRRVRQPYLHNNLDSFKLFLAITEFFCERTYDLHSEISLRPASLMNESLSDKEYSSLRQKFYKMVLDSMGPALQQLAVYYFGDMQTFLRFVVSFYESKLIENRTGGGAVSLADVLKQDGKGSEQITELLRQMRPEQSSSYVKPQGAI